MAAAANREDGASELHVARLTGEMWEWLGAPLLSIQQPFRHAQQPSIAFAGEQPVVAWVEELHAVMAGLFVSKWNGTSWTRLGSLTAKGTDYFLTPAVAVGPRQHIWLAWNDGNGYPWVARWGGARWNEVGGEQLEKLAASQGPSAGRELRLALDSKGQAWLLWLAYKAPSGAALALAKWDGVRWTAIPAPRGPEGKDATAWSASLILRNDAPIVAWSQADMTDNHHLYMSELTAGDRWIPRLANVHLAEGVSNVTDVELAAGKGHTLYVSWDEPGSDKRSTRIVRAYPCATGESPAASPKSIVERDTWPTTVEDAAKQIVRSMNDESKARVRSTKKEDLGQYNFGWGMGIRNALGLWRGNDKLLASCGNGTRAHPESCSMVIIEAVWSLLQLPKEDSQQN